MTSSLIFIALLQLSCHVVSSKICNTIDQEAVLNFLTWFTLVHLAAKVFDVASIGHAIALSSDDYIASFN